jgi:AcrR family transcriptional regulator
MAAGRGAGTGDGRRGGAAGATTRDRILRASLVLFAAKGFEGTGMGDIAARVGIAKSVIYHHFESKEAVLAEIGRRTIDSAIDLKRSIAAGAKQAFAGSRDLSAVVDALLSFVLSNREAMVVLLRESLRGGPDAPLFVFWEANLAAGSGIADELGLDLSGARSREVLFEAFFMLVLPMVGFAVLGEPWARRFGHDRKRLRGTFAKVFRLNLEELWFDRFFAAPTDAGRPGR